MESFLVHFGVDVASALVAQEEFGVCVDVNVGKMESDASMIANKFEKSWACVA